MAHVPSSAAVFCARNRSDESQSSSKDRRINGDVARFVLVIHPRVIRDLASVRSDRARRRDATVTQAVRDEARRRHREKIEEKQTSTLVHTANEGGVLGFADHMQCVRR